MNELEAIYAEIPRIPDCTGKCAAACGPITMFEGEWKRVKRAMRGTPKMAKGSLVCPMLSPNGWCQAYSVRPWICRAWGTVKELACPEGCQPERWLTRTEAEDIFRRVEAVAGPRTNGPVGSVEDLWGAIALEARAHRQEILDRIKEHHGSNA